MRTGYGALWLPMCLVAAVLSGACAGEPRVLRLGLPETRSPAPVPASAPQEKFTVQDFSLMLGLIQRSGDLLVRRNPSGTQPTNYADIAYACIALLDAAEALRFADPDRAQRFATYGAQLADHLVRDKDMNRNGRTGWGLDTAYTDQTTHVTIPANQEYAFQTGIAGYCLVAAYERTLEPRYLTTAEEAAATFWREGTARVDSRCQDCYYFWFSTHPNYAGRLVKNTNLLMGMFVARLARITSNEVYRTRAVEVFNSQRYEIGARRNFNYLGANDPRFAMNAEKHMGPEMWAFDEMAQLLGLDARAEIAAMTDFYFRRCGQRCAAGPTEVPGILAGCALAHHGEPPLSRCRESVRRYSPPFDQVRVNNVALIGLAAAFSLSRT